MFPCAMKDKTIIIWIQTICSVQHKEAQQEDESKDFTFVCKGNANDL